MKIDYRPTPDEVRRRRKERYLSDYPIETQIEALTEAAMGRPDKLDELLRGLAEIRETFPFAEEVN